MVHRPCNLAKEVACHTLCHGKFFSGQQRKIEANQSDGKGAVARIHAEKYRPRLNAIAGCLNLDHWQWIDYIDICACFLQFCAFCVGSEF